MGKRLKKQKEKKDSEVSRPAPRLPLEGVVIARECATCGHHEIGLIRESGEYLALKPGMKIIVVGEGKKGKRQATRRKLSKDNDLTAKLD